MQKKNPIKKRGRKKKVEKKKVEWNGRTVVSKYKQQIIIKQTSQDVTHNKYQIQDIPTTHPDTSILLR